jgi:hypothetical protein
MGAMMEIAKGNEVWGLYPSIHGQWFVRHSVTIKTSTYIKGVWVGSELDCKAQYKRLTGVVA